MATTDKFTAKFTISVVGEVTDETYKAEFVTSTILSGRQQLAQDQLFREYVGKDPQWADPDVRKRCHIMATINSSLQAPIPQFWIASGMGWDLLDDSVVSEVLTGVVSAQNEASARLKKKTEDAAARLKTAVERGPDKQEADEEKK
jgi:hypothetical protein